MPRPGPRVPTHKVWRLQGASQIKVWLDTILILSRNKASHRSFQPKTQKFSQHQRILALALSIALIGFIGRLLGATTGALPDGAERLVSITDETAQGQSLTPSLLFVSAFIDLGPEPTDKTVHERLEHFRTLASSGIRLLVFASPSRLALVEKLAYEHPNIERVIPIAMHDLATVQIIRSFPNLQMPTSLTSYKDTRGFLELMLAKIDFVHVAMQYTDASHLAWIDFNIAHVFDSPEPLKSLQHLSRRNLRATALAIAGIWDQGVSADMASLLSRVNWRFAGGFFLGDRASLEGWYKLSCDALQLFLSQTNTLVWEVNFWAWLELTFPQSFRPYVYKSDHDASLVAVPLELDVRYE